MSIETAVNDALGGQAVPSEKKARKPRKASRFIAINGEGKVVAEGKSPTAVQTVLKEAGLQGTFTLACIHGTFTTEIKSVYTVTKK